IGNIEAKRTSTNYDFAALMVRYFSELDLKKGDVIAIGASGSFPALVVATLSAAKAMELQPVLIYSIGSSMYGANIPDFTLIQMLDILYQKDILPYKITAISLGGDNDRADGLLFSKSKNSFFKIAESANLPFVYEESIEANLKKRLWLYQNEAGGKQTKCFINIGGASINHGHIAASINFPNGLVTKYQNAASLANYGLIFNFLAQGTPVIHLLNIKELAIKNSIMIDPVPIPKIGKGAVYYQINYNKGIIIAILSLITLVYLTILIKRMGGFKCK
ncbi:MAG: poly-gamma-glutamate system protein, partial [Desulfobacterales bacterium]|nr:poly-gamma-glutamate system protein [Desulfobacterales bacterium]